MKSFAGIKSAEVRKEVVSLLEKLSTGWRLHRKVGIFKVKGICSQLVELYRVNESLSLAWSIDIARDNSKYIQILKVWDVLPPSETPKLAKCLDALFENYTVEAVNRCKCRSLEGNLVVPMSWPADSGGGRLTPLSDADHVRLLESRVASLSLKDEPGSSTGR
ncbi:hypothetical protein U1Q18_039865 [Sarracenia purpurea var. burkii]